MCLGGCSLNQQDSNSFSLSFFFNGTELYICFLWASGKMVEVGEDVLA